MMLCLSVGLTHPLHTSLGDWPIQVQRAMQVSAAICNILIAVLARTPKGALRSKFPASSQILMRLAEQHLDEVVFIMPAPRQQ